MSDALSATAGALVRRALLVLPADRPRGRADIARLPAPIGRLLAAELDRAVQAAAPSSPWVDGTDDRVGQAASAWLEAAHAAAQFPADDWERAVEDAAGHALEHLVRPVETLAAAAVPDEPVAVGTAVARGRRFGPYPYLLEVAERYAERKGIGQVDRQTFAQLLGQIDRRMVEPFSADDWIGLLRPLFDLVAPVSSPEGTVPADVLRAAFEARGAAEIASRLSGHLTEDDLRHHIGADDPADLDAEPSSNVEAEPSDSVEAEPSGVLEVEQAASGGEDQGPDPAALEDAEPEPSPVATGPPTPHPIAGEGTASVAGLSSASPDLDGPEASAVPGPLRPVSAPVADLETPAASTPPAPKRPAPLDQIIGRTPGGESDAPRDEPLWKRLARQREQAAGTDAAPPPPAATPDPPEDDVPLWKRFAQSDLAERLPAPPAADLDAPAPSGAGAGPLPRSAAPGDGPASPAPAAPVEAAPADDSPADDLEVRVLGPDAAERRSWFVAELFAGDRADYRATLEAIDAVDSYTEATTVVSKNVLVKNRVSPFSDAAIAFIDDVQFQFEKR